MICTRRNILAGLVGLLLAIPAAAQEKLAAPTPAKVPSGSPAIQIVLGGGDGVAKPVRCGCPHSVHTGGGDIQVVQPAPHVLQITMLGAALAKGGVKENKAEWNFDLSQVFTVVAPPGVRLKLLLEGRLIGLLRSGKCCCHGAVAVAEVANAGASVSLGDVSIASFEMPARSATCGDNQFIHMREAPCGQPIEPGCYTLHQTLDLSAVVRKCPLLCNAVAAEFAPSNALDPAWIGLFDPFHGTVNKDFGFRVTVRVVPE